MTPYRLAAKPLLWSARGMAALGLLALGMAEELAGGRLGLAAIAWMASFLMDRRPDLASRLRGMETIAVTILVGVIGLDWMIFRFSIFVTIAHFLLAFSAFKLLGIKERKDCLQIGLLGGLELLAACTLSADIRQGFLMLGFIPLLAALLFWNHAERFHETISGAQEWPERALSRFQTWMAAAVTPLTLLMTAVVFLVFPRLTFNVRVPGFTGSGSTAYTDQVNLSRTGTLEQNEATAAWVAFTQAEQHARWGGYLRGDVLDYFDGKGWSVSGRELSWTLHADGNGGFIPADAEQGGTAIDATITLLDTQRATLFMPGIPRRMIANLPALQETAAGTYRWTSSLNKPLQYRVLAEAGSRTQKENRSLEELSLYLQLPSLDYSAIQTLSQQWISAAPTAIEKARAIEGHLRNGYGYSLDYGKEAPAHPVEHFLIRRKQGLCGHFASAMAVILRLESIPSRVVAGYSRGEWNEPASQVLIREKHAHAWVEAWVDGQWITFDPTPLPADTALPAQAMLKRAWHSVRQYWDYLGFQWNQVVIEYNLYDQIKAVTAWRSRSSGLGMSAASWMAKWQSRLKNASPGTRAEEESKTASGNLRWLLLPLLGMAVVLCLGAVRHRHGLHRKEGAPAFYRQFLDRMAKAGLPRKPSETGQEFARRATVRFPAEQKQIVSLTRSYYSLRFGKK